MLASETPAELSPELHTLSRYAARLRLESSWLNTQDPEQASMALHQVYSRHRMSLYGAQSDFRMNLARRPLGCLEVVSLAFGTEVELEQAWTTDFVLVSTQLSGRSRITTAVEEIEGAAGLVVVDSPGLPVTKRFSHDSWRLNLRVERQALEALATRWFGHEPAAALQFLSCVRPGYPKHDRWLALLHLVASHGVTSMAAQMLKPVEEMVMLTLLTEMACLPTASLAVLAPRHVRRAEEYMRAHMAESLTLANIADAAGTSIRSLNAGFRQYRQTTPMRWLHEQRLLAVHESLQRAGENDTVASIALRCGVNHLGRLARDYQRRFGVNPSSTLRRH